MVHLLGTGKKENLNAICVTLVRWPSGARLRLWLIPRESRIKLIIGIEPISILAGVALPARPRKPGERNLNEFHLWDSSGEQDEPISRQPRQGRARKRFLQSGIIGSWPKEMLLRSSG